MAEGRRARAVVRAWRWIWEPSERKLHVDACPRCGATVVLRAARPDMTLGAGAGGESRGLLKRLSLSPPVAPDEGQLLAACAEHGWAPYNERSIRLRGRSGAG